MVNWSMKGDRGIVKKFIYTAILWMYEIYAKIVKLMEWNFFIMGLILTSFGREKLRNCFRILELELLEIGEKLNIRCIV